MKKKLVVLGILMVLMILPNVTSAAGYVPTYWNYPGWDGRSLVSWLWKRIDQTLTIALYARKMATNLITASRLADNSVGTSKLANYAVTKNKLANGAVTAAKIAAGAISEIGIADGSITTAKLADSAVTSAKIADSAITSAKILDGTIATADIADGAVDSAKILDGTIATADIADDAVTAAKIAQGTAGQLLMSNATPDTAWLTMSGDATLAGTGALTIATGAVTSAKILDGTIATADIADGAVNSAKIADGTIVAADIATGAVDSAKILDGTIVDADVAAGAAIANTKLANPNAYYTVPLTMTRQLIASLAGAFLFRVPVDSTLVSVGASARASGGTTPTLTVDVKEAGVSVLSAAFSVTAGSWSTGTISDSAIAAANNVTIDFTIGGTSPTWDDITVLLTFKTAHAN